MIFTVDSDKNIIKARGTSSAWDLPEDVKNYIAGLESSFSISKNISMNADAIRYKSGCIEFGRLMCSDDENEESVFKPLFKLDLRDFALKDISGNKLNINSILQHRINPKIIDDSDSQWLTKFWDYWDSMTYKGKPSRTKLNNLFRLGLSPKKHLCFAEKVFKISNVSRDCRIFDINLSSFSLEEIQARNPWEILKCKKTVYDFIYKDYDTTIGERNKWFKPDLELVFSFEYWDQLLEICNKNPNISSYDVMSALNIRSFHTAIKDLVLIDSYSPYRLLEYLFQDLSDYQGFSDASEAANLLKDYVCLSGAIYENSEDWTKYPKHLKTDHDIAVKNFNASVKDSAENVNFNIYHKICEKEPLRYSDPDIHQCSATCPNPSRYIMTFPENAKDLLNEGKDLSHCVGSWVSRISPQYLILFMREKLTNYYSDPIKVLTVHLDLHERLIVDARGFGNRPANHQEVEFLKKYCEVKNFQLSEGIGG